MDLPIPCKELAQEMKDVRNNSHTWQEVCFAQFLGVDDEDADHIRRAVPLDTAGGDGYHRARWDRHLSPRPHSPAPGSAKANGFALQTHPGHPLQHISIAPTGKASGSSALLPPVPLIQNLTTPAAAEANELAPSPSSAVPKASGLGSLFSPYSPIRHGVISIRTPEIHFPDPNPRYFPAHPVTEALFPAPSSTSHRTRTT